MNKAFIVAKKEFLKYVRSKWFRVFMALPIAGILLVTVFTQFSLGELFSGKEEVTRIGIADRSNVIFKYIQDTEEYDFIAVDSSRAFKLTSEDSLKGFIVIPEKPDSQRTTYYSSTVDFDLNRLEAVLTTASMKARLNRMGMDEELAGELNRRINIAPKKISGRGGGGELIAAGMFMVIFLYMFILMASQLMAKSAVEEKLNGIIELIISDISPRSLLLGKFLGVSGSVVLLLVIWFAVGFAFMGNAVFFINQSINISLPAGTILFFAGAFIFGYSLYTFFILLFVSTVSNEDEVNQAMGAGVVMILIPYFLSFFWVLRNPDSMVSVVSSFIPFFTPLIMPLRLSISTVPLWQALVTMGLLIITTYFVINLAGKIYRTSMLLMGKKLNLREAFRLLRKS